MTCEYNAPISLIRNLSCVELRCSGTGTMKLKTGDFDYPLEEDLIAQTPLGQRDRSRLMVLNRADGRITHRRFFELPQLLHPGDLLVLNDTSVVPAKFALRRRSGAIIDGLFLREVAVGRWEVLLRRARRCHPGERLALIRTKSVEFELTESLGEGRWLVGLSPPAPATEILERTGATPLPPYIHRSSLSIDSLDRLRYQTIYASRPGAVAAPTAGLHFTQSVFASLTERKVRTVSVTLHVGLGTFAPVKSEELSRDEMHSEWYEISPAAADALNAARKSHRRVVAVGTTSVRVLESFARRAPGEEFHPTSGWTDLFLHPPADFHVVDAMITNFHLPRSTLLMLVAGFCSPGRTNGVEMILNAYTEARREHYRFYSYGDAMFIE